MHGAVLLSGLVSVLPMAARTRSRSRTRTRSCTRTRTRTYADWITKCIE